VELNIAADLLDFIHRRVRSGRGEGQNGREVAEKSWIHDLGRSGGTDTVFLTGGGDFCPGMKPPLPPDHLPALFWFLKGRGARLFCF